MKTHLIVAAILTATLTVGQSASLEKPHITGAPFPLVPGNYWIYEGTVSWTPPNSSEVLEKKVRWRMEVMETIDRRSVVAARIKGHPIDLAWYEEGREPREYLIVQVWRQRYYLLQGERVAEVLRRLRSDESQFIDLVLESELFLEFPLVERRNFGQTNQLTREDGFYFWVVGQPHEDRLEGLHRSSKEPVRIWEVSHRTIGSLESFDFATGLGFTRYRYHHNGTVSEFDVKLVEIGNTRLPKESR